MPTWLIKLFHSLGRKQAAKVTPKREGITQIPDIITAEGHGAGLYTQLREAGFSDKALTKLIKNEQDIIRLVNKVESMQNQRLKNIERKFFDPSGKMKPAGEDIVKKGLEGLEKKPPFQGFTPKIVPKETEAQIKARMIKENRSNVQKSYLRQLDKKIMDEIYITAKEMENMSSTALDDLRRSADPVGMRKQFGEITEGRGLGDFADDPDFFKDDYASGGIAGQLHLNEGGRIGYAGGKRTLPKQLSLFARPKIGDALRKLSDEELKIQKRAMKKRWGVSAKANGGLANILGV